VPERERREPLRVVCLAVTFDPSLDLARLHGGDDPDVRDAHRSPFTPAEAANDIGCDGVFRVALRDIFHQARLVELSLAKHREGPGAAWSRPRSQWRPSHSL
jgi:hypothetical protein